MRRTRATVLWVIGVCLCCAPLALLLVVNGGCGRGGGAGTAGVAPPPPSVDAGTPESSPPRSAGTVGSLQVTNVTDVDVSVTVTDSQERQVGPVKTIAPNGSAAWDRLEQGAYRATARRDGYSDASTREEITPGGLGEARLEVTRLGTPASTSGGGGGGDRGTAHDGGGPGPAASGTSQGERPMPPVHHGTGIPLEARRKASPP